MESGQKRRTGFLWGASKVLLTLPVWLIGLAGVPGDLQTWERWMHAVLTDPEITALAEKAVAIAEVVNTMWFRTSLIAVGILLLLWSWRPIWRIRHRLWFKWRRALSDVVWIPRADAFTLVLNSDWAEAKRNRPQAPVFRRLAETVGSGTADELKFRRFIGMTLDSFAGGNPSKTRMVEGNQEFDEGALRKFVARAFDEDVRSKYGAPPDFPVS